jgi:hypothetical protein
MALHFSADELAARRNRACRKMAEQGLDGLLMFRQETERLQIYHRRNVSLTWMDDPLIYSGNPLVLGTGTVFFT